MIFVPVIPPHHEPPSPRTRELAVKLSGGGGTPGSVPVAAVAAGLGLTFAVLVLVKRLRGE
ncbi:MAG: hypothetical protein Q8N53_11480 [Longimicrobiales bacterium]|nr:hypothetical protein [Longimicrobiales bacterium]